MTNIERVQIAVQELYEMAAPDLLLRARAARLAGRDLSDALGWVCPWGSFAAWEPGRPILTGFVSHKRMIDRYIGWAQSPPDGSPEGALIAREVLRELRAIRLDNSRVVIAVNVLNGCGFFSVELGPQVAFASAQPRETVRYLIPGCSSRN